MDFGNGKVRVERDGHRADVVLNRPDKRNAIDHDVIHGLNEAFEHIEDTDARSVALLGEGDVFCAGMDLNMMYEYAEDEGHEGLADDLHETFTKIETTPKPVVAGIKKAAIAGGFELTLPADFRIIGDGADYGAIEVKLGLFPSGGSTQRLPRLIGLAKAKELVLTGDFIEPDEAERIGLVNEVCEGDVDARTREFCDELTKKAPLGVEKALEAFDHALDVPLEDGLKVERYLAEGLYDTHDAREGFGARIEGREPEFEGR